MPQHKLAHPSIKLSPPTGATAPQRVTPVAQIRYNEPEKIIVPTKNK
jgi:hypothetical protein